MAIQKVEFEHDGATLVRRYSDQGYLIERDGVLYPEAIDPIEYADERVYTETDILIDGDGDEEATAEDYQAAFSELGVELNG